MAQDLHVIAKHFARPGALFPGVVYRTARSSRLEKRRVKTISGTRVPEILEFRSPLGASFPRVSRRTKTLAKQMCLPNRQALVDSCRACPGALCPGLRTIAYRVTSVASLVGPNLGGGDSEASGREALAAIWTRLEVTVSHATLALMIWIDSVTDPSAEPACVDRGFLGYLES